MKDTYYNWIMAGEGYKDYYSKSKELTVIVYRPIGTRARNSDGSYTVVSLPTTTHRDNSDGTFTVALGTGTHRRSYELIDLQRESSDFEASFETVNILFLPEAMKDNMLEVFVKAATSLAGLDIAHSVDGSYEFTTDKSEALGNAKITGFFPNDDGVYYQNRVSFVVKNAQVSARAAHSCKFKFTAQIGAQDEFKIYAVEINSSGLIFEGEVDA
jgi:hypothetical protein